MNASATRPVNRPTGILYNHDPSITRDTLERDYVVPTIQELRLLKTPKATPQNPNPQPPEGTGNRWNPVPHHVWVDSIRTACNEIGLQVVEERFAVGRFVQPGGYDSPDIMMGRLEHDLALMMTIRGLGKIPGSDMTNHDGCERILGGAFSNVQRKSATLLSGARVAICHNGMLNGEILVKHKQTNHLEPLALIRKGLQRWVDEQRDLDRLIQDLRDHSLSPQEATAALGRCAGINGQDALMGIGMARRTFEEWTNPRHEVFAPRNAWTLYNAATETMKHERMSNEKATSLQLGLADRLLSRN